MSNACPASGPVNAILVIREYFSSLNCGKSAWTMLTWIPSGLQSIVENRQQPKGDFVDRLKEIRATNVLTEDQTYAQGIGFFQAGFETTSNTLCTLSYNLAKNPDVQVSDEPLDLEHRPWWAWSSLPNAPFRTNSTLRWRASWTSTTAASITTPLERCPTWTRVCSRTSEYAPQ